MRTHATRHFDVTVHFSRRKNFHGLVRSAFFDHHDDVVRSSSRGGGRNSRPRNARDVQSERARELGSFCVVAQHEERGVGFAREPREANGDGAGEEGSAVDHDEGEGAAAQENIGAPRAACGIVGAHNPEAVFIICADVRPIARRERAGGIDVRDPPAVGDGAFGDAADESSFAAPGEADEFGKAAAGKPSVWKRGIQIGDASCQTGCSRSGALDDLGEILAEES